MSIKDEKKKYITVRKVIFAWRKDGLRALKTLFDDPENIVEESSWVEKVKRLLEEKNYWSLDAEICLVSKIFNTEQEEKQNEKQNGRQENQIQGDQGDSIQLDESYYL